MAHGSVNKVLILGRLGQDPMIKNLDNGMMIANFSLATNSVNAKTKEELTEWHNCVAFGKIAEIVSTFLKKGDLVFIEGSLRTSKYTDKEGHERSATKIMAHALQMCGGGKKASNEHVDSPQSVKQTSYKAKKSNPAIVEFDDDMDIPF